MKRHAEADFLEVRDAFSGAGLSPKLLRRAIRAELGKRSGKFARPLHRSPALREVFKQGVSLASVDGGRLRPAHLGVALVEQWEPVVSSAVTKLGHHPDEVLKVFRLSQSDSEPPFPTETAGTLYRERRRKPCRP